MQELVDHVNINSCRFQSPLNGLFQAFGHINLRMRTNYLWGKGVSARMVPLVALQMTPASVEQLQTLMPLPHATLVLQCSQAR